MVDTLTTVSALSRLIARAETLPSPPPAPQGMRLIRTQKAGLVEGRYAQQIAFPRYILYQLWLRQRTPTEDSAKAYLHRMRGQALWRIALWAQENGLPLPVRNGVSVPDSVLRRPVVTRAADDPVEWWDVFGTDASQYADGADAIQSDMREVAAQEAQALAFQNWFYSDFLSDVQVMQLLDAHWNGQASLWSGQEFGDAAGIRGSFSLVDPAMDRYIRTMSGAFVSKINETTRKVLAESLWQTFSKENLSVDAIARKLPSMLKGTDLAKMSRIRSHMIAVTEVARAETFGNMVAMAQTGVQRKQWIVTVGACGICLDNQSAGAVPLMDAFPSGNYAPPGHVICRCDVSAAVSEEFNPGDWADYADADIDAMMVDSKWMNWSKEMGDLNLRRTWQETANTGMLDYSQLSAVLDPGIIPDLQKRLGDIVDVEASYAAFAQRYSQKTGIPVDQLLLQQGTLGDLLSRFSDMSAQGNILAEIERGILSRFKQAKLAVPYSLSPEEQIILQWEERAKTDPEFAQRLNHHKKIMEVYNNSPNALDLRDDFTYVSIFDSYARGGSYVSDPARAVKYIEKVLGYKPTLKQWKLLAKNEPYTLIAVEPYYENKRVWIEIDIKGVSTSSKFTLQRIRGKLYHLDAYVRNLDEKEASSGAQVITLLDNLQKFGINKISAQAARSYDMNGYWTWAQLGFVGDIPTNLLSRVQAEVGNYTRVEQLMQTSKGRKWWRKNGESWNATFDFTPGSYSMRVFEKWKELIKRRGDYADES